MRKMMLAVLAMGFSVVMAAPASAVPILYGVDAFFNSSSGTGVPLLTAFTLTPTDRLVVSVDPTDCWSAGPADRTTNADGLVGLTTNVCRPVATTNYGLHPQLGANLPFAALVGRVGLGVPFVLGTSYNQIVGQSGPLTLMFWDSNNFDNFGAIVASVDVIPTPEPATLLLTAVGLFALRRRFVR